MITAIGHVTLLVRDQNEALRFYPDILGMQKRADMTMENGFR